MDGVSDLRVENERLKRQLAEQRASMQAVFDALFQRWGHDTAGVSVTPDIINHPIYQAIIAMGMVAVPFILAEIERRPSHWHTALRRITGGGIEMPRLTTISGACRAWVEWGRERGLVGDPHQGTP